MNFWETQGYEISAIRSSDTAYFGATATFFWWYLCTCTYFCRYMLFWGSVGTGTRPRQGPGVKCRYRYLALCELEVLKIKVKVHL
jgi:hypothetical protein